MIIIGIFFALPFILALIHRLLLNIERRKLAANGKFININNHAIHVYSEGASNGSPILIFLSGSGTSAPIYDFKPLYSRLSPYYRIAVVERAGYGYSRSAAVPRDIDSVLSETREALTVLGITSPYILVAHSMSGLEALRWTQRFPNEVKAIIGIDICVPSTYTIMKRVGDPLPRMRIMRLFTLMGIHRFPYVYPVSKISLSNFEHKQARLLTYRNVLNKTVMEESTVVYSNARTVQKDGIPNVPILLLTAKSQSSNAYVQGCQEEFARQSGAEIIYFDCGHYIHQYQPENAAEQCRRFIELHHITKRRTF